MEASDQPSTVPWVPAILWASKHCKHWVCLGLPNVSNQLAAYAFDFSFEMTGWPSKVSFSFIIISFFLPDTLLIFFSSYLSVWSKHLTRGCIHHQSRLEEENLRCPTQITTQDRKRPFLSSHKKDRIREHEFRKQSDLKRWDCPSPHIQKYPHQEFHISEDTSGP